MTKAHVFITDDTLRQALHETIDHLRAERDTLRAALEVAYKVLGNLGYAYEGAGEWEMMERIKAALSPSSSPPSSS